MKSSGETNSTESSFSPTEKNSFRVAIAFYGSKTIGKTNKISDKLGRILLVEATNNDTLFVLIKIYYPNTALE